MNNDSSITDWIIAISALIPSVLLLEKRIKKALKRRRKHKKGGRELPSPLLLYMKGIKKSMKKKLFYQWLSLLPIIYLYLHTTDTFFTIVLACITVIWGIATVSLFIK